MPMTGTGVLTPYVHVIAVIGQHRGSLVNRGRGGRAKHIRQYKSTYHKHLQKLRSTAYDVIQISTDLKRSFKLGL